MIKNYVLKPIYNDENECINDMLSVEKVAKMEATTTKGGEGDKDGGDEDGN